MQSSKENNNSPKIAMGQMKPRTFPPLAIAGAQLSWLPSV
jgi:hypothetical protein